ncbi:MAG: energy-coupling factor transporter ATPase [Clostridiales bacterium]|nr:energy-coupling factor transporter ATPase [Clostridiales bacterium]
MSILRCDKIEYLYSTGTPFETAALKGVDFIADEGELIGIIGHTGSGKSTLIQHFNGLLKPHSGAVFVDENDIWAKENSKKIRNVRFTVGLCFQYPEYQIFEDDVFSEIAFGPKQEGLDSDEIKKRVYESMDYVGISRDFVKKSPLDLSGGQKRRVAIASIIAMKPRVLVLDEPCAGLDPAGRRVILNMIKEYQHKSGSTVIFVSHSMEDVAELCTRVYVMKDSSVYMSGTVKEVYSNARELFDIGLDVPEVTQIFLKLKEKGVDCRTDIYNLHEAQAELSRLLGAE